MWKDRDDRSRWSDRTVKFRFHVAKGWWFAFRVRGSRWRAVLNDGK